jgi:hypothetical protein
MGQYRFQVDTIKVSHYDEFSLRPDEHDRGGFRFHDMYLALNGLFLLQQMIREGHALAPLPSNPYLSMGGAGVSSSLVPSTSSAASPSTLSGEQLERPREGASEPGLAALNATAPDETTNQADAMPSATTKNVAGRFSRKK